MQIESYRTRLEEFEQNLNRELYRYHSGLKDRLDLMAVYSEHSKLGTRGQLMHSLHFGYGHRPRRAFRRVFMSLRVDQSPTEAKKWIE